MSFDLRQTIREAMDASDSPDPYVIAQEVVGKIPARHLRDVVAELLPHKVRLMHHKNRGSVPADVSAGVNGKREVGHLTRDPWRMGYDVPGVGWRYLAELTAEDCDALAEERSSQAAALEVKAKSWRLLSEEMASAGAATARDLGDRVFEILHGAEVAA